MRSNHTTSPSHLAPTAPMPRVRGKIPHSKEKGKHMKKFIASCLLGGALIIGSVGGAFAAPGLGTPGEANCVGQTTAFLAQAGQEEGIKGFAGAADAGGFSVKEAKQLVREVCQR